MHQSKQSEAFMIRDEEEAVLIPSKPKERPSKVVNFEIFESSSEEELS